MRSLKFYPENDLDIFYGIKKGVRPCCIIFYDHCWLRSLRPVFYDEYDTSKLSYENGIILCPECLVSTIVDYTVEQRNIDRPTSL